MARYYVNASVACGSDLPIINITGSAAIQINLYQLVVGFTGSPADVATLLMLERTTDAGTGGTSLTVNKRAPLTATATGTAKKGTYGAAPTDDAELLALPINQRATHRLLWPDKYPLVSVASANNGIMLNSESSGGTPTLHATMEWEE